MPPQQSASLEMIARRGSALSRIRARIPTYLKDLRENPAWFPMFVLARWMPARKAHWLTAKPVPPSSRKTTLFAGVSRHAAVEALRREGIFPGINLPKEICADIAAFAMRNSCFGNFDRHLEFLPGDHAAAERRFDRALLSGHYYEKVLQCEAALAVQQDPLLQEIAAHYLGGQARVITTRIWWTFPTKDASDSDKHLASLDKYHFDLDDWRMLKFFFYLTPVDEGAGPHVYVRGSHKRRALRHQFTLLVGHSTEDVLSVYGKDKSLTLLGDAGFGLVEDVFGFHMGTVAQRAPRLAMEVGFGVSPPSRRRFHGEPVVRGSGGRY
jgi:hypothetical protein